MSAVEGRDEVYCPAQQRVPRKGAPERAPHLSSLTLVLSSQDTWPGVDQAGTGTTGAAHAGTQGVGGQSTLPSATHPTSIPGSGTEKVTDASRLVDAPPTFQDNTMVLPHLSEHQPAAVVLGLLHGHWLLSPVFRNKPRYHTSRLCVVYPSG